MYSLYAYDKHKDSLKTYALYRAYSADNELLYVGMSARVLGRIAEHKESKDWFRETARVDIVWFATKEEVVGAEAYAIKSEHPLYNKHLNDNYGSAKPRKKLRKRYNLLQKMETDLKTMGLGQSIVVNKENSQTAIQYMKRNKGWGVRTKIEKYNGSKKRYAHATHVRIYRTS